MIQPQDNLVSDGLAICTLCASFVGHHTSHCCTQWFCICAFGALARTFHGYGAPSHHNAAHCLLFLSAECRCLAEPTAHAGEATASARTSCTLPKRVGLLFLLQCVCWCCSSSHCAPGTVDTLCHLPPQQWAVIQRLLEGAHLLRPFVSALRMLHFHLVPFLVCHPFSLSWWCFLWAETWNLIKFTSFPCCMCSLRFWKWPCQIRNMTSWDRRMTSWTSSWKLELFSPFQNFHLHSLVLLAVPTRAIKLRFYQVGNLIIKLHCSCLILRRLMHVVLGHDPMTSV